MGVPVRRNPVVWIGIGLLATTAAYLLLGALLTPSPTVLSLMSDGRCTGFPNGVGQWQWGDCCMVHDTGGTDGQLAACLLDHTPVAATPLVFLALALMAFGRPIYNLLQRLGIAK